jgi:MoaA/NifB/PqqE/SkfB family radical SAM enzyme
MGPVSVNFLITSRCDRSCSFCNFQSDRNKTPDVLKLRDIQKWLREYQGPKPFLFFGGGEPFLREDIFDILTWAKKEGYRCGVNTHGGALDAAKAEKLGALEVDLAVFSLYGPAEVHDKITGVVGSFDRTMAGLRALSRRKGRRTRCLVSATISPENLSGLERIVLLARAAGADAVKFEHLNFLTRAERESNNGYFARPLFGVHTFIREKGLGKDFVDDLRVRLRSLGQRYRGFVLFKPVLSRQEMEDWYAERFASGRRCFFLWHSFFVRPDAHAVPCQFLLGYSLGDIRTTSLAEAFDGAAARRLRRDLLKGLLPSCARCCKL